MLASAAEANVDKTWTKDDLMEKGQGLYNSKCSCLPPDQPVTASHRPSRLWPGA